MRPMGEPRTKASVAMILSLLLFATHARSETPAPPAGVVGVGLLSCADFAREFRANPRHAEAVFFSWAQGAMSGAAIVEAARTKRQLDLAPAQWPADAQRLFLRDFCDRHPLQTFMFAVGKLISEIEQSQGLSR